MTPRKVRLVADLIKGLSVNEAEAQLLNIRKRAALPILKLLRSAVANIKNNKHTSEEKFFIETLKVDGGPMLKRYLPRARGMATPIQKKTSHVTLVLAEKAGPQTPRFKIVVPKKTKLPPEVDRVTKRNKPKTEEKEGSKPKRTGFFKKLFQRKSGFAK